MKRIFITGCAGFIGFHLAQRLHARGDLVIGLDNFNDYYDPKLKRDRAQILAQQGIDVLQGDIRDRPLIRSLLERHQITHLAHLAAQAGVRHSLLAPDAYVASNLEGFVSMLEACKDRKELKLIYASSSSVYGLNTKIPFSVDDPTDKPANLYGATKKANELIAHAYHHLYGISVTGLRYFTAYGPWGRPDMAYYHFTQSIINRHPICIHNGGKMRRDFTYIVDIVDGTIAAIDLGAPCELFNLGHHQPIELLHLIERLEEILHIRAIREMAPEQPGEVLETYADIEKSKKLLGFHPKISFDEGISRFVSWYKIYTTK